MGWDVSFKNQINSGEYSKTHILGAICGSLYKKLYLELILPTRVAILTVLTQINPRSVNAETIK